MTQFTVTPEYIAQAAANAHSTAADIQNQLSVLQNYVLELGGAWLGVASGTFQQMMVNYSAYARMLHNALDDIGSGLQGNFVNYVAMEQENIAQLAPIEGMLTPINLNAVPTGATVAPGDITR